MDEDKRQQQLLTALTTEHFVLQTSRSATIAESVGRATVYMSLLSASLIGLGFVSNSAQLIKPYLGAVLPTLIITGLLTFGRLVQTMRENSLDLQRMRRIRAYYHHQFAGEHEFFADAISDEKERGAVGAAVGVRPGFWPLLLTTAAMVAAVTALLIGLAVTLLIGVLGGSLVLAITIGAVVAVIAFAAQIRYVRRGSVWLNP